MLVTLLTKEHLGIWINSLVAHTSSIPLVIVNQDMLNYSKQYVSGDLSI